MSIKSKRIFSILFSLFLTYGAIEAAAFLYLYKATGSIQSPVKHLSNINGILTTGDCTWADKISLHPYLSLRYHQKQNCSLKEANSRGMLGEDLPTQKRPEFYNVLLLGGSVAEILHQSGELEKYLNANFQSPNKKPFRIWNGAMSAGQQPRQAIAHMMYADFADLVVSLEGFNEQFSYSSFNSLESPPHVWFELENQIRIKKENSNSLRKIALKVQNSSIFRNSYFLAAFITVAVSRNIQSATNNINAPSLVPYEELSNQEKQEKHINTYGSLLRKMGILSEARNQHLVIFLQPVPAIHKPLTPEDRRVASDLSYRDSYLKMVNSLSNLSLRNVKVIPILDTFQNYKEDLYADLIHFRGDSKGNEWLSKRISTELMNLYKWKRKQ